jgi:hypothetical protein
MFVTPGTPWPHLIHLPNHTTGRHNVNVERTVKESFLRAFNLLRNFCLKVSLPQCGGRQGLGVAEGHVNAPALTRAGCALYCALCSVDMPMLGAGSLQPEAECSA